MKQRRGSLLEAWKRVELEKKLREQGLPEDQIKAFLDEKYGGAEAQTTEQSITKRPIGRPKGSTKESSNSIKKKRGRPPKLALDSTDDVNKSIAQVAQSCISILANSDIKPRDAIQLTKSLRDLVLINNDENIMRATREDESTIENILMDYGGPIDPTKVCFNPNYSRLLLKGTNRYKVMYSGRGAGKSWAVAMAIVMILSGRARDICKGGWNPDVRIQVMRKTYQSIRQSIHSLIVDIIAATGSTEFDIQATRITHKKYGGSIQYNGFYPASDKNSLVNRVKGIEGVDICLLEEADDIGEEYWNILVPTIRKQGSEIWAIFNPSTSRTYTYKRFAMDEVPADSWVLKTSYLENKYLSESAVKEAKELEKYNPSLYSHIYLGEPREYSDASIFASCFKIKEIPAEVIKNGVIRRGIDWSGGKSPAVCLDCRLSDDGCVYIVDAFYKPGGTFGEVARYISGLAKPESYVYADSENEVAVTQCRAECNRIFGANPIKSVSKWRNSVNHGIQYLRNLNGEQPGIIIAPHLTDVITEFQDYNWNKTADGTIQEVPANGQMDHAIDTLRYALSLEIKHLIKRSKR